MTVRITTMSFSRTQYYIRLQLCCVSFTLSVINAKGHLCWPWCYTECHYAECRYSEFRYTEFRYAECRGAQLICWKSWYISNQILTNHSRFQHIWPKTIWPNNIWPTQCLIEKAQGTVLEKLRIRNLRKIDIFRSKASAFLFSVAFTGLKKHTSLEKHTSLLRNS